MMRSTRLFKRQGHSPTWQTVGEVSPEKALFVTPDDQKGCCGLLLGELACEKACFQETGWRRFGAF